MEHVAKGSDGRRLFTAEFKRTQIDRILKGEVTAAELSRELGVARSLIQRWKYLATKGAEAAVGSNGDVVPLAELRAAQGRIKELERLVGRQTLELEILRVARDEVKKKTALLRRVCEATGEPVAMICRTLQISRATAYRKDRPRPRRYHRQEDEVVLAQLRQMLRDRASYGYRRARRIVNRQFGTGYNRKRIQRVMRLYGLALPIRGRRRRGRRHEGQVECVISNQRWCSDVLEIACWNGEVVHLVFALDCCDREVPAHVSTPHPTTGTEIRRLIRKTVFARYGTEKPEVPIEWLTDNEGIYTALETVIEAERNHLAPITTPVASPESNGMAEAFVNTFKRDYVAGGDLASAARVMEQIPGWIADYNTFAPHSSLGMKSPDEFRREQQTVADTGCLTK